MRILFAISIFLSSLPVNAKNIRPADDCRQYLKDIFSKSKPKPFYAPEKPTMQIDPEEIVVQKGKFEELSRDPVTGQVVKNEYEVLRAIPDPDTAFGRYVESLDRQGTAFFFSRNEADLESASGYFSRKKNFVVSDPDELVFGNGHFGKSIVVPLGQVDPREFQVTMMHEAFHAYGERLREKGISFRFNSYIMPGAGKGKILGTTRSYTSGMHAEEIHTYVKDFAFRSVIAHNRETLKMIEDRAKRFPRSLPKQKVYDQIRIAYDSVIDSSHFDDYSKMVKYVVSAQQANLSKVEIELLKLSRNKSLKNISFERARRGKLMLETADVKLVLNDLTFEKGKYSPLNAIRSVRQMRVYNRVLLDHVISLERFNAGIEAKGYFTANEYLELKKRLSKITRLVQVRKALK
jgi:hypothetical protein